MSAPHPHLLVRRCYDARTLVAEHPPRFTHPHKKLIHSLSCPKGAEPQGTLTYSRWRAMPLPERLPKAAPDVDMREDVFDYEAPHPDAERSVEWHVNFADPRLFVAYAGPLLAQDEMQVVEHPALASLLESLKAKKEPAATEEEGVPTPVLVRGVERRCALSTNADAGAGRPEGLYGNRFARAPEDAIRQAVSVLDPPTITNVIAIAAPGGGRGTYSMDEIRGVLLTAYTGFRAAVVESDLEDKGAPVVVHTGHWGTGAFGGNKVLMTMLQLAAARLAEVHSVVFHTFDGDGSIAFREGDRRLRALNADKPEQPVEDLLGAICAMGFRWGESDGN